MQVAFEIYCHVWLDSAAQSGNTICPCLATPLQRVALYRGVNCTST